MKRILELIYSSRMTVVLLLILASAMGTATFIEDKYDTETAHQMVYGARWFEFLFVLLTLNFIGNIVKYNMLSRKKITGFVFHFAFIVMIIGAALTRYTGFNGTMHIRQGEASSVFYSSEPYLIVNADETDKDAKYELPMHLGQLTDNSFHFTVNSKTKGKFDVSYKDYYHHAADTVLENAEGGSPLICLVVPGEGGRKTIFMNEGEVQNLGAFTIAYNNETRKDAIRISRRDGVFYITSPIEINRTAMPAMTQDTIQKDSTKLFREKCLYNTGNGVFVFKKGYTKAKKDIAKSNSDNDPSCLVMNIAHNGKTQEYKMMGGNGFLANYEDADINGTTIKIAFGSKEIHLPFSIALNQFVLERYAGSMSPSSFLSKVTVMDDKKDLKMPYEIFMNHVLDYQGYRFFQTSYDPDEKGTLLSVNHDALGTWVSYLGYFLLALGFLLTLFNPNSRFYLLAQLIRKIRLSKTAAILVATLLASTSGLFAQGDNTIAHVSSAHAEKMGHVITQTFDGRFEPVHTLAYDAIHKISKKDELDIPGVGKMDAMQLFLDMFLNSNFWKAQKVIYVKEKSVQDVLGVDGKYASFQDFFDASGNYKLRTFAETSFRKKSSEQNTFDKEVIKVDERANVAMMVFNGSMMKLFPVQGSTNNTWSPWDDSLAQLPLSGSLRILNEDLQLRNFNYNSIMGLYMQEVYKGAKYGDYSRAEKIMEYMKSIQKGSYAAAFLPTDSKVNFEISYNKSKIFTNLRDCYGFVSMILLLLSFIDILTTNKKLTKVLNYGIYFFTAILGLAFCYHTYGMILRWYLTGHAPWSTGYEALLLIGWGGILAGFFFIRNSKITMAATSLLAFFVLMTASHSSYDPQLTNLQPVLKSYWLIIHVACLTISYGFLGLGFILGLINMLIYVLKNPANRHRLDLVTSELTHINEMNITIGLFLATVGTFLGGIWANESWGKYWGWDAKETWALVIVITYTIVLHLRFIKSMKGEFIFNIGSILGYGSVMMTFFGVNYYLSKGLHSYAAGEKTVFPVWAWIAIFSILTLIVAAGLKMKSQKK